MQNFKTLLIQSCSKYLEDKIRSLDAIIKELTDSANADTKSTAGDKHETNRAMMHLEQEKTGNQLKEAEKQLSDFSQNDYTKHHTIIGQTSLFKTDKGFFFIAASIGKLIIEQETVFVVSVNSPIAIAFKNKRESDVVSFNGITYKIQKII